MIKDLDIPEIKLHTPFTKTNGSYYDYKTHLHADKKENVIKIIKLLEEKGWEDVPTSELYKIFHLERHVIKLEFSGPNKYEVIKML